MGADAKSNLQKCGEILINMKTKNKKTKIFTFNCVLCNIKCDQLKTFSLHLEQKHFQQLTNDSEEKTDIQEIINDSEEKSKIFEREVILEELTETEANTDLKDIIEYTRPTEANEDPLESCGVVNPTGELPANKVKLKNDNNLNDLCTDFDDFTNEEMDYEDLLDDNDCDYFLSKKTSNFSSDVSSNDSKDDNVVLKKTNSKLPLNLRNNKQSEPDVSFEDKEFIKALFQAFEKQSILWKLKERTKDKQICQKGFETIANEVNEKFNTNITWNVARNRINAMRIDYSYELEKQRKGNEHQIPWYYEHMKFLKENIDYMLNKRYKKLDSRFKNMDQSLFPILIEIYRKHEDLWQVNNIAFGIPAKRDEAFKKMVDDLKSNHNLELTANILQDYIKYLNRLYSKDKELQLKCELEKSEFIPSFKFYNDMSFLNESQGPFKCAICNTVIRKYEHYHIHVAEHNNTMPFKCPVCEMNFKIFQSYRVHAKRHLSLNSFPCKECGKVYPFKSDLDRHLSSHTGEKPFLCQICGASFRFHRGYDNHIRHHEKRFRHECDICKRGFNRLTTLNDHVKSHLNIRDIVCDTCGKSFTAKRYLNNHKLIHEDKKRYKCNVCGKEFAQGGSFRYHCKQHLSHVTAAKIIRMSQKKKKIQN